MAPPMIRKSTLRDEIAEEIELGRDFRAADDGGERTLRVLHHLFEGFELRLHAASDIGGQAMGEALGRGMRTMGDREGVVDIDVAELGEFGDEGRIVRLLAAVEAGVFEQHDVAVGHFGDRRRRALADAIGDEFDRPLQVVGERGADGPQRIFAVGAFRPPEMREQDDLAAFVGDFDDRRRECARSASRRRYARSPPAH